MKEMNIKSLIFVLQVGLLSSPFAQATGIPTVDVASILQLAMNAKDQAQQALEQLNTAKDAIQQAKSQYQHYQSIMEGNNKLGDFLNDPLLNQVLPTKDWSDIYHSAQDITDLRQRYGLTSSNPNVQAAFDKLLSQAGVLEKAYDASNSRIQNAEQLRNQLNTVDTPKDREQLALRYQQEYLELQNQQLQIQNTKMLMEEKEKIENTKRSQDFTDYMTGASKIRPTYN
jgi:type IV secretion system protein VirB5